MSANGSSPQTDEGDFRQMVDVKAPADPLVKQRTRCPRAKLVGYARTSGCFCVFVGIVLLFLWYTGIVAFDSPNCVGPIEPALKFGCATEQTLADKICCHNTRFAEPAGFLDTKPFFSALNTTGPNVFYDSVCGLPLFVAPVGRSFAAWQAESTKHGWPSFRKEESFSENIEILAGGEMRSTCGVHLGHNLPDGQGDRYCINLVCMAGAPATPAAPAAAAGATTLAPTTGGT
jgi:peptide methionine sulfoxide reductase MsrB